MNIRCLKRRTDDARNVRIGIEDKDKSEEDWQKLTLEVLKLKCMEFNLVSTGKKIDIVNCLYNYFLQEDAVITHTTIN